MKKKRINMIAVMILSLLFIIGCGGGGGDSQTVISEPGLELTETSLDETVFDGVVVKNSAERQFTIKSTGDRDLRIDSFSSTDTNFPGDPQFKVVSTDCIGKLLAKNATCTFIVSFTPAAHGTQSGTISINGYVPKTFSVSGFGYGLNVWINQADFTRCSDEGIVLVDVTVTNPSGPAAVTGLTGDNFQLWQSYAGTYNLETISSVSGIVPTSPAALVLALDLSGSLVDKIEAIKVAAQGFIDLLSDQDEAAICKFATSASLYPSSGLLETTDPNRTLLKNYIATAVSGGSTALYEAAIKSIDRVYDYVTGDKKAIIILSDGANKEGTSDVSDVIVYAQGKKIPIFTIYFKGTTDPGNPEILQQMANETGGQYFNAEITPLASIFSQIRTVLSSEYTIQYDARPYCSGDIPLRVRVDWNGLYGIHSRTF